MSVDYVSVKSDGCTYNIHVEDFCWAANKLIAEGVDVSYKAATENPQFDRLMVATCYGWGRRIAPAL